MYFIDRIDAGTKLAARLKQYNEVNNGIVIGLPRGGVPVAAIVANELKLPLDIVCPRKIGAPSNKEFAIGAITETGEGVFDTGIIADLYISRDYIEREVEKEKAVAAHRLRAYRGNRPLRNLKGKTVILVDDGLATGSTMKAAIMTIKSEGAKKIVVAIPVGPADSVREISGLVDEMVCLSAPIYFSAVGQFYENFSATTDDEVIELLSP